MSDPENPNKLFRTSAPLLVAPEPPKLSAKAQVELARENLAALKLRKGLPFLYDWKWYKWALAFYESTNRINLLVAGNQISKSSTQIRKCINWATDQSLWPSLWARKPSQFWYLYPTQKQVNAEFETKWKLFLPRLGYENDSVYGYRVEKKGRDIVGIHFYSGVHVYFKTYMQNAQALQTGSVDALFCDEELDVSLFDELMFRLTSTDGYFHMVFTATMGQEFWRIAMEPKQGETENLPTAFKQTVSLYDALEYTDGTKSHWTIDRIKQIEARCSTHSEVLKRVYGHFLVDDEDRIYPTFSAVRHMKPSHPLPKDWLIYAGVDIGGGTGPSGTGHCSAIIFVAVKPNFRVARVFMGWKGDNIPDTTAGDVVEKFIEMKNAAKIPHFAGKFYDWGAKDFGEIAARMGEPFQKAEKSHAVGEDVLNTLFKNDMLQIYETEELVKLGTELLLLRKTHLKRNARDDFVDALRYAVSKIPWDWTALTGQSPELDETPEKPMNATERQIFERRKQLTDEDLKEKQRLEDEFEEWNELYNS